MQAMILAHERSGVYGDLLQRVRATMFFGVPHRGADSAYWANIVANMCKILQAGRGTNTAFVEALQKNSKEFARTSQQFIERAAPLKIRTFYETERYHGELVCVWMLSFEAFNLGICLGYPTEQSLLYHALFASTHRKLD